MGEPILQNIREGLKITAGVQKTKPDPLKTGRVFRWSEFAHVMQSFFIAKCQERSFFQKPLMLFLN
jgi:hypothetical protein